MGRDAAVVACGDDAPEWNVGEMGVEPGLEGVSAGVRKEAAAAEGTGAASVAGGSVGVVGDAGVVGVGVCSCTVGPGLGGCQCPLPAGVCALLSFCIGLTRGRGAIEPGCSSSMGEPSSLGLCGDSSGLRLLLAASDQPAGCAASEN